MLHACVAMSVLTTVLPVSWAAADSKCTVLERKLVELLSSWSVSLTVSRIKNNNLKERGARLLCRSQFGIFLYDP